MKRIQTIVLLAAVLFAAAPVSGQKVTTPRSGSDQVDQVDQEVKSPAGRGQNGDFLKGSATDAKPVKKKSKKAKMSPERMTYVMDFVREHHPELGGMLELLKENQPVTFDKAMSGIDGSVRKLEALKSRRPDRYPMGLTRWKLSSRVSVATAKLRRKDSEVNRLELEELLREQADFQVETLKSEREQLQKRMDQLNKQIADTESEMSDQIKRRIETVRSTNRKKKKPATPKKK